MRVIPGYGFALEGHQTPSLNQAWLVVRVEHQGYQSGILEEDAVERNSSDSHLAINPASPQEGNRYENRLFLIPHNKPWRSPLKPRPIIRGTQVAHVTGPEGEEIYCDEWGRIKLQFPWDRLGHFDENSSCWVRVLQDFAGAHYGSQMIPRVGDEVLVKYLNGDPDQPIVVGRTYHSTTEPPYALPKHKTRMTIKSKTHKGNGFNELRFEDEKGQEEIFLHAEKDLNHIVNYDETSQIGNNRAEHVSRDETIYISNNRTETVAQEEDLTINRDQNRSIGRNRITKIGQDELLNVNNNRYVNVHGDTVIHVGKELNIEIAQNGTWEAGELFEQICEQFDLEGYELVELSGPGGSILISRNGIELIGDVFVEGELVQEAGVADRVSPFETQVNVSDVPPMKVKFLQSPHSTKPMIGMPYTLLVDGNEVKKGMTDSTGEIEIPHKEGTKHYEIRFANGASYSIPIIEEFEKDTDNDELINEGFYPFLTDSDLSTAKIYSALVKGFFRGK